MSHSRTKTERCVRISEERFAADTDDMPVEICSVAIVTLPGTGKIELRDGAGKSIFLTPDVASALMGELPTAIFEVEQSGPFRADPAPEPAAEENDDPDDGHEPGVLTDENATRMSVEPEEVPQAAVPEEPDPDESPDRKLSKRERDRLRRQRNRDRSAAKK